MDYNRCADIFKAIGHPVRLKILKGLTTNKNCNVNDMVEKLSIPQSTLSQHLGVLRNLGIITPEKNGVKTCYKISNTKIDKIISIFEE